MDCDLLTADVSRLSQKQQEPLHWLVRGFTVGGDYWWGVVFDTDICARDWAAELAVRLAALGREVIGGRQRDSVRTPGPALLGIRVGTNAGSAAVGHRLDQVSQRAAPVEAVAVERGVCLLQALADLNPLVQAPDRFFRPARLRQGAGQVV